MKCFYIAICIMLASVGLCEARQQHVFTPYAWDKHSVDFELSTGLGIARDCDTRHFWSPGASAGLGLNYTYQPTERVRIRTGLSEQNYISKRVVDHPYPYVMDMDLKLRTVATRFSAGGELVFPKTEYHQTTFMGVGVYGDVVHFAKASNLHHYLTQDKLEVLNLKNSFKAITPGIMFNIGFEGPLGRLDVRYTVDIVTFEIPGIQTGKQRRAYIGLHYAHHPDSNRE